MRTVREPRLTCGPLIVSALPTAPSCARQVSRVQLAVWGVPGLTDTADLVVTELVTNAVQACQRRGERAQVMLRLSFSGCRVRIEVWDPDPALPCANDDVALLDESGRGLYLVDVMSGGRWGARACPD
ncbi:MAG: ATP-binding protein, partial [Trebonia sp.]